MFTDAVKCFVVKFVTRHLDIFLDSCSQNQLYSEYKLILACMSPDRVTDSTNHFSVSALALSAH